NTPDLNQDRASENERIPGHQQKGPRVISFCRAANSLKSFVKAGSPLLTGCKKLQNSGVSQSEHDGLQSRLGEFHRHVPSQPRIARRPFSEPGLVLLPFSRGAWACAGACHEPPEKHGRAPW